MHIQEEPNPMKQLLLGIAAATALTVTTAFAQGYPQNPSPQSMPGQNPPSQSSGQYPPSQDPGMTPNTQTQNQQPTEKKLKGCVESQGGSYVLRGKHDKTVALMGGQDLSSYVGQTVAVHGMYASASKDKQAKGEQRQFTVSKVDSVASTCKLDKGKNNSAPNPSGTNGSTPPTK
jgi:metal-dependent amidase/aminoacylase/carboxypeptidase family protein